MNKQDFSNLALALSGGGDSMALLHMLLEQGHTPTVLHFNHTWSEWGDKAETFVRNVCAKHSLSLVVGKGRGRTATNAEEKARHERYAFFARECQRLGLAGVMTAHTQTDDVEGFLMRLARGSGLTGLSGMKQETVMNVERGVIPAKAGTQGGTTKLHIIRPLLNRTREELRTYLKSKRIKYLNDPTNTKSDTFRARIRKLLPHMERAGLHPQHIAASMQSLRMAEEALTSQVQTLWQAHGQTTPQGASFPRLVLLAQLEEIQIRLVAVLLQQSGQPAPLPRRQQLRASLQALRQNTRGKASLGHCLVSWTEKDVGSQNL